MEFTREYAGGIAYMLRTQFLSVCTFGRTGMVFYKTGIYHLAPEGSNSKKTRTYAGSVYTSRQTMYSICYTFY